jgi:hypothetical protein
MNELFRDVAKPILAGFGITARRLKHKKVTVQYPDQLREQYPRTRWRHYLTRYDNAARFSDPWQAKLGRDVRRHRFGPFRY